MGLAQQQRVPVQPVTSRSAEPLNGYSTQARISLDVAAQINNGRIRFWLAADFNPLDNDPSSNPLRIYEQLDRAAKVRDPGSEKAANVLANLRAWVQRWHSRGLIDRDTQARALFAIRSAPDDGGFRPSVFFLASVVGWNREEQPDEYTVENHPINDPSVRRILPANDAASTEGNP